MRRGSSKWRLKHYGKPCLQADHVQCQWYPGHTTVIHAGTGPAWRALGAVMAAYRYEVPTSYTGSYNCRGITGRRNKWSGHAWPVALDINAKTNPYIRTPSRRKIRWGVETDMPAAMIGEIESITASGVRVFTWGGRWRTIKDAMHFELRVTLAEIAGGISSPRGVTELPKKVDGDEEDDEMMLKRGDKGVAVGVLQKRLIAWNRNALPKCGPDRSYGAETVEWVKVFQQANGLTESGNIDGVTAALLLRAKP